MDAGGSLLVDVSCVWFWRAKDVAYIVFEHFTFVAGTITLTGATVVALVACAAVAATGLIVRTSPTPRADAAWLFVVAVALGGRVAAGGHVHHAE